MFYRAELWLEGAPSPEYTLSGDYRLSDMDGSMKGRPYRLTVVLCFSTFCTDTATAGRHGELNGRALRADPSCSCRKSYIPAAVLA